MITWIVLLVAGYLLGSIPLSYLAGRTRGINLKKQGTQQVGASNLWRLGSRRLSLLVGAWDLFKGIIMVVIAYFLNLDAGHQLIVGLAVIIGHNWPVFLRFHGGRGIATLFGLAVILPIINNATISPWPTTIAFGFVLLMLAIYHSTPLPVLISAASLPITSWLYGAGLSVSMAYLAIFLVVVLKRLTAQKAPEKRQISNWRLFVNRLFFDRDIADRHAWVHREFHKKEMS